VKVLKPKTCTVEWFVRSCKLLLLVVLFVGQESVNVLFCFELVKLL